MSYSIGEVARFAGVTVRTLHHYDAIGLLSPSRRTGSGRRGYEPPDLDRLQRILFYRELDLPLEDIAGLLDGDEDPLSHLARQRDALQDRIERLERLVTVLERTMEARKMGINLDPDEMFEVFGDFDPGEHAEEAEQRWGETDAWRQSRQRTSSYTKADWLRFKNEQETLGTDMVAALDAGIAPDDERAMDLAERARLQIHEWFYDCPHAMHVNLGQMYVDDPRFKANYDRQREGLAVWLRDAIVANAKRHGVDA
ncbi:MAG TPA: MerR family transcriptional regulator [Egicoccus sp.]|nr:MerR family transcriptional regulator [Egicoccus sp.]HSK22749.1 MerR family transcriptional regulator [Egicoccus sp.]